MISKLPAVAAALLLTGCATAYAPQSMTGGFLDEKVADDVWRVSFAGNGYTSQETVQTYWLYHCAVLALEKGYAGFRLSSRMELSQLAPGADASAVVVKAGHAAAPVYVYGYGGGVYDKPSMYGEIRLLKAPVPAVPGRVFDAARLKAFLEPYVNGPKCGGNVCPHVHRYLYPDPAATKAS
jgi:hypothetical protein